MLIPSRRTARAAIIVSLALPSLRADVSPNPLFSEHAVLQQGMDVPVWGTADNGEKVAVEIAGRKATTIARDGQWLVRLDPLPPGGPYTLTISSEKNTVVVDDVLVGEVWVCSGQSNMERELGPRPPQKPIENWEAETAAANHPQIREFHVDPQIAFSPASEVHGQWIVCSPKTVVNFSAVGYFFGRDILLARRVPVGLIHSSWGGTPAEAWTSRRGLTKFPELAEALKDVATDRRQILADFQQRLADWYRNSDPGSTPQLDFQAIDVDTHTWAPTTLPGPWEENGLVDFDGVVWYRKTFDVPEKWAGTAATLHLGVIDDADTTWINGVLVGAMHQYNATRVYKLPPELIHPGLNTIAVRVLDIGGPGGFIPGGDPLRIAFDDSKGRHAQLLLDGDWLRKVSVSLADIPAPPVDTSMSPSLPTVLYNAMIAPLVPYAIRGIAWYQGESDASNPKFYRRLLPNLIADWRDRWKEGDIPFLFVQIAPNTGIPPELREAQLDTWRDTANTAMIVTIDCGDANDIHPARKQPVGARLALAARALAYGEHIPYSGPVFRDLRCIGHRALLDFTHVASGMYAKDGPLRGFQIAGEDRVFHPARGEIQEDRVVLWAPEVDKPSMVRYGWANVPDGNLFNYAGLPASPFRSNPDDDKPVAAATPTANPAK